jgi:hypothetical protein
MGNIKTGKDSVVIGSVEGDVGEGSVVIGPTDNQGNTVINHPMAVGRGASAGPGSIAIGAGASAGSEIFHLINKLKSDTTVREDSALLDKIDELHRELRKDYPDDSKLSLLWETIQTSASVSGSISLVQQISNIIFP